MKKALFRRAILCALCILALFACGDSGYTVLDEKYHNDPIANTPDINNNDDLENPDIDPIIPLAPSAPTLLLSPVHAKVNEDTVFTVMTEEAGYDFIDVVYANCGPMIPSYGNPFIFTLRARANTETCTLVLIYDKDGHEFECELEFDVVL